MDFLHEMFHENQIDVMSISEQQRGQNIQRRCTVVWLILGASVLERDVTATR